MKFLRTIMSLSVLGAVLLPASVSASSQGFYALNNTSQTGMLVSLTANPGVIQPADGQNAKSLVGVVAPSDDIALDQQPGQVAVRTEGLANALVSTLNGNVSVGDRVTTSSLEGVGTKASGSGWIVGTAQGSLDASTKGVIRTSVTDSHGAKHTVYVASIPLLVKVTYYTAPGANQNSVVPNALQSLADSVAHKHVSLATLVLSIVLLLFGLFLAAMLINSAVRGGMLAIARQPLTRFLVQRREMQAFGLAALILMGVTVAAFLVLRFF